jgi:plasmid stabilization system protein ParE
MQLIVKPEAEVDIQIAYYWYETKNTGLGNSFLDDLDSTINQILSGPKFFQIYYKNTRVCFTSIFSFGVHFIVESYKIFVIAVLHTSRDPKNWR